MSKEKLILEAVKQGHEVFELLKKDWYKLKLPGSAYSPAEFVAKLLIGHLGMTQDDVLEALENANEVPLSELKAQKILSGMFRVNDDVAKIAMAALLGVPEIAAEDYDVIEKSEVKDEISGVSVFDRPVNLSRYEDNGSREPTPAVKVVTQCPHCRHDFERCENGFYDKEDPVQVSNIVAVDGSNEPGCCHVDSKNQCISCTQEETTDCSSCNESIVLLKGIKCKDFEDCGNIYCTSCVKDEVNDNGYCSDCRNVTCDNCDEEFERGSEKQCSNPKCESSDEYCVDCATRILNKKGWCNECSGEEFISCHDCDQNFTSSLVTKCKSYDDCGTAYCSEHVGEGINSTGYCQDCSTIDCCLKVCTNSMDAGTEKRCSNPDCKEKYAFCDDCARRYLNKRGLCSDCSGEEEWTCDGDCGEEFTSSRLKECKGFDNCQHAYCKEDAKTELDRKGYCSDCADA